MYAAAAARSAVHREVDQYEDDNVGTQALSAVSYTHLVVGGKEGLQPVEKTVIDRCVHVVYRKYFENPIPENMPLLEDLYNACLLYTSRCV